MQPSKLAPSVTPRPVRANANASQSNAKLLAGAPSPPATRGGRTYTLSMSPAKSTTDKVFSLVSPVSPSSPAATSPWRKKPLVLSGDVRNLDSNFDLTTARVRVSLAHVTAVLADYGVVVGPDEAQALLHEFEENNDAGLAYAAFVAELVETLRLAALNRAGTSRTQLKKTRLAAHVAHLSARRARLENELHATLARHLLVPWATVRDALRRADPQLTGRLPKAEFARVMAQELQVPLAADVLDALALREPRTMAGNVPREAVIDYTEFLLQCGAEFNAGDPKTVSESLVFARTGNKTAGGNTSGTLMSNTMRSPGVSPALLGHTEGVGEASASGKSASSHPVVDAAYMEQLRIVLNEKISSRYSDVKKAFMALDKDGNGTISAREFTQVLRNFNLVVQQHELDALMARFDANGDGVIDYREFFAIFGDVIKPSAVPSQHEPENASLLLPNARDTHKNRTALSSPGNELKEALAALSDDSWRSIFVELEMSDPSRSGLVSSAELLRVLGKFLGEHLPRRHFAALFRACGSHANHLMSYRALVRSYRGAVLDAVDFFKQDTHANTEKTFRKSPTESLVMVWSIRVQRAQLPADRWQCVKEALWTADARRQGRVAATEFAAIVRPALTLSDAQISFLCFFYEDKTLSADGVHVRYASFLTDYEDPGLEPNDTGDNNNDTRRSRTTSRVEGKARVKPPHLTDKPMDSSSDEQQAEEKRLKEFCSLNVRSLEASLRAADVDAKGFVPLEVFRDVWQQLSGNKWKETAATNAFLARYVAQHNVYYRGLLLDCDASAGLQTQALVVQDDDEDGGKGGSEDTFDDDRDVAVLDVYQAKDALRHLLTTSRSKQRAVYKLFQRVDPGKTGVLTFPEVRRALERLGVTLSDESARDLLGFYEEEDDFGDKTTGRVKYLQLLFALGGKDPETLDNASDLSSNCSYYSAITISPRAVRRPGGFGDARQASRDSHVLAAQAVTNAIDKPMNRGAVSGAAAAAAVERKIQTQLQQLGKTKWRQVARHLQQVDSERRGTVTPASFKKVLDEVGVRLDDEELVRLQLKYDVEQNGRLNYPAFLRHLTNSLSDTAESPSSTEGSSLPTLTGGTSPNRGTLRASAGGAAGSNVPEALRVGVKAKWKPIYASLKTLDKPNVGRVTAAQFRQLLEWYALPVTDDALLQMLRLFDREDGLVDYNAFMRACIG